tara:strand:- start:6965 stop:7408 length:444 start_codon:yes stop_codon:yes gene_type:complete
MHKIYLIIIFFLASIYTSFGQNGTIEIKRNYKLDSIIKIKKEINSKIQNLKIQIYSGTRDEAEVVMQEYIEVFKDTLINIIYETPNYKIWVGNYYTQIEADKKLIKIRRKFSSAFIFRPEFFEKKDAEYMYSTENDSIRNNTDSIIN